MGFTLAAGLVLAIASPAQLTTEQRVADFRYLASLYAQRYAPYEWKRELLKYDLLDLQPWLERVQKAKDDLDYYEIAVDYVASLNDGHAGYFLPSTFAASLGFTVDIYDGKVLIDSINRQRLPAEQYPFEVGDELVSVDGSTAQELIKRFAKYLVVGHQRATERSAAAAIVSRWQDSMPRAHELGEEAKVVVRRAGGEQATYSIPWRKTGVPVTVLAPGRSPLPAARSQPSAPCAEEVPSYLRQLERLRTMKLPQPRAVLGQGALKPVFDLPEGFTLRLGAKTYDSFYSGTFEAGGLKIGFLRIPDFDILRFVSTFEKEIAYFQENTDGLIIDLMRNPGGYVCLAESLLARLIPYKFRAVTLEARVLWSELLEAKSDLEQAQRSGAKPETLKVLEFVAKEFEFAYRENKGCTRPIPVCGIYAERDPATDKSGNPIAYTKPLMLLIDEISFSAAEVFAAVIQDSRRGPLFGMRTGGGGGSVADFPAGIYAQGSANVTTSLVIRKEFVSVPGYPTSPYIENVGVHPDVVADYMTRDNLMNKGRPFVEAFSAKMVEHIQANR